MSTLDIKQSDREALLRGDFGQIKTLRKRARIIAVRMDRPFTVETDRGIMTGVPGDFLVTNHPDDDPESDLWTISAERKHMTYESVE